MPCDNGAVYVPPRFAVDEDGAWEIVRSAGAGLLVAPGADGLLSVYVPAVVSDDRRRLRAHVARANPFWRAVTPGAEALALFVASSAYVSPSYYPSTREDPNAVPTWNYEAVEVRGALHVHDDADWLRDQTREVTNVFEEGRDPRWWADDLEPTYRERQLRAIVGVEIDVTSIQGKAKLSQNRPEVDRREVRARLAERGLTERHVAERMPEQLERGDDA